MNGIEMCYEIDGAGEPLLLLHREGVGTTTGCMPGGNSSRATIRQVPVEHQPPEQWEIMRQRHRLGDEQIFALGNGSAG